MYHAAKKHSLIAPDWSPNMELGIPQIDREHQKLFRITQKMYHLIHEKQKNKFACVEGIKYLNHHTMVHFSHEEEYMRSIGYPGYEMHKRLHDNFKNRILPAMEQILEESDYSTESVARFLGSCIGWLSTHTTVEDLAIVGKVPSNWNAAFDQNLASFLSKSFRDVVKQLSGLHLRLVNMHYSGERFGKTVHYKILYSDGKGSEWFVQTSLETKLVLYLVTKLFNHPSCQLDGRLDSVMLSAFKQVIRQIVYHIGVLKRGSEDFYVTDDFLLSEREISKMFRAQCPRYSMLFASRHGFLTFCADACGQSAKSQPGEHSNQSLSLLGT